MNVEEGKQVVRELITAFPTFESVAKDSPDIGATHRAWMAAWSDLELTECRAVLDKLIKSGGIGYEDYRAPGPFIRRLVMAGRKNTPKSEDELARELEERIANRQAKQRRASYVGSPMARALSVGIEMQKRGDALYLIHDAMDKILEQDCKELQAGRL